MGTGWYLDFIEAANFSNIVSLALSHMEESPDGGGRSKAFQRLIALTVFTQILDGLQDRFETPVVERVSKKFACLAVLKLVLIAL